MGFSIAADGAEPASVNAALGLEYQGFTVRTGQRPERVLEQVIPDPPDCIVADVRMAGLTGLELRQRLAAHARAAKVPCLALSGSALDRDIQVAREAGFDDVPVKPCLPPHSPRLEVP